jgi:hypothetical protein
VRAFDVLGDPARRRIRELLASGGHASGDVVAVISKEFGIGQRAVSMQLRVLRESGFAQSGPRATDGSTRSTPRRWRRSMRGSSVSEPSGAAARCLDTEIKRGRRSEETP